MCYNVQFLITGFFLVLKNTVLQKPDKVKKHPSHTGSGVQISTNETKAKVLASCFE